MFLSPLQSGFVPGDSTINHLHSSNFLSPLQSGFVPGDSTINGTKAYL